MDFNSAHNILVKVAPAKKLVFDILALYYWEYEPCSKIIGSQCSEGLSFVVVKSAATTSIQVFIPGSQVMVIVMYSGKWW
jgi:hypothetical protein